LTKEIEITYPYIGLDNNYVRRWDMIGVYELISGKYDINSSVKFKLYSCRRSLSGVESRGNL